MSHIISLPARFRRWLHKSPGEVKIPIPLFQRVVVELQSHCNRDCFFCCRESDSLGKRKNADGSSVKSSMPTENVLSLFHELQSMGFTGYITFHQLSEAFLDTRIIEVAHEARRLGMRPYVHTNGDVLRNNEALCRQTAEVFEYVVVGLYDYSSVSEREEEKEFWRRRLHGTKVLFSLVENVYVRTHSAENGEMSTIVRQTHPQAPCAQPLSYLLIHYNGDVACCCEDMYGELLNSNIFQTSIREVWYSSRHAEIISALNKGERKRFDLCSRCTMGPSKYVSDPLQLTEHLDE